MNHTSTYQLSQWDAADRILREDFNSDNAKLDAALAAQTAAMAQLGNCQFYSYSYTGDGQCGASYRKALQFPWPPDLIIVMNHFGAFTLLTRGMTYSTMVGTNATDNIIGAWSGNTVQITTNNYTKPDGFLNHSNYKYFVFAFRAKS